MRTMIFQFDNIGDQIDCLLCFVDFFIAYIDTVFKNKNMFCFLSFFSKVSGFALSLPSMYPFLYNHPCNNL